MVAQRTRVILEALKRLDGEDERADEDDRDEDEASREPRAQGHVGVAERSKPAR